MLRILHDTNIDFIRLQRWAIAISALFIVPGLVALALPNVNFRQSIDFTGGTLVQVEFRQPVQAGAIRSALREGGISGAEIAAFGSNREYVIRAQDPEQVAQQAQGAEAVAASISAALNRQFAPDSYRIVRTEAVGPKVASELWQKALTAILISFVATLIYLAWRFEWRFGVAAIVATAHDIVATMVFIKYMDLEISLIVVGGILTVLGYSLNDTIVIFDRIRDNLKLLRRMSLRELINRSVNETLPRTLTTGVTTVGTILALLIFAGNVIRPFAWVMLFGIIVGTFSSIYIAAPVLLYIERRWPRPVGDKGIGPRHKVDPDVTPQSRQRKEPVATR